VRRRFAAIAIVILVASAVSARRRVVQPAPAASGLIVYVGSDANGQGQVFTIVPDGSNKRQLTGMGGCAYPAWSRDGSQIAFTSAGRATPEIWIMERDGSNQRQITFPPGSQNFVPTWSPDGSRIAFSSVRTGHPEIFVMNSDGSNQRQLTTTSTPNGSNAPFWYPDGSRIAFASDRNGKTQVYSMRPDGSDVRQLTTPNGAQFPDSNVPVISPDGTKIAFWSGIERQYGQVWVMDPDGGNRRVLSDCPPPTNCDNPAWSPDGRQILFETNRNGPRVETWVMNADGSDQRMLLPFGYGAGRLPWSSNRPSTSQGRIAYADRPDGTPGPDATGSQIFTVDSNGSDRRQITNTANGNSLPAWSPDGKTLAFVSGRSGSPEIWTIAADGSTAKQITFTGTNILPAWSPDGTKLAFVSTLGSRPQIWVMNADGTSRLPLTNDGNNSVPAWSPDGRRIAFWSGNDNGFGQIWTMDAGGSNKKQLTFPRFDSSTPNGSSANAPAWLFNDKIAYWSGIEHQYGQIWTMNGDGSNQQQLTNEPAPASSDNPSWSADGTKILFDSSRTGRPEIWIMDADGRHQRALIRDLRLLPGRTSWQPVQ
jgi:Tol biopolymer transport system component